MARSSRRGRAVKSLIGYTFMFTLVILMLIPFYILVVNSFKPQVIYTGMDESSSWILCHCRTAGISPTSPIFSNTPRPNIRPPSALPFW